MQEFQREPMTDFVKVSREQLERADRRAFVLMAEITQGGFAAAGAGSLPLDVAFDRVLVDHEFGFLLMQLPNRGSKRATDSGDDPSAKKKSQQAQFSKSQHQAQQHPKPPTPPADSAGKGKGRNKGKKKKTIFALPDGTRVCFAYQNGKCPKQAESECEKGSHTCWIFGCGQKHPGKDHN
jgi:hypothetical protein